MEKWEYKIISIVTKGKELNKELDEGSLEIQLASLGKEGWELVNVVPIIGTTLTFSGSVTQKAYFIFKRKISGNE